MSAPRAMAPLGPVDAGPRTGLGRVGARRHDAALASIARLR